MKNPVFYRTIEIDGFSIFYRESGSERAPTLLLLHGLPSSSRMYRGAISATDVASLDGCWDRTPSRDMTTNTTVHESPAMHDQSVSPAFLAWAWQAIIAAWSA